MPLSMPRIAFLTLIWLLPLMAAPVSADSLDRLIELSGIEHQLAATPQEFKQSFLPQVAQAFDADTLADFAVMLDRSLASDLMVARLRGYMQDRLTPREIRELIRWHVSVLGQRITRLETAASTPPGIEQLVASMDELLANPQRVAAVQSIESQLQLVDYNLALVTVTQGALLDAMVAGSGQAARVDRVSMQAMLNVKLTAIRPEVEHSTLAHLAYIYRDLSAADMQDYLAALQRPEMVKFNRSMMTGMADLIEDAFGELSVYLGERIQQLHSQQVALRH